MRCTEEELLAEVTYSLAVQRMANYLHSKGRKSFLRHKALEKIGNLMEDGLLPDNRKLEARVHELAADIGSLLNDLYTDADEIHGLFENLDKIIRRVYRHIQVYILSGATKEFTYEGWKVHVLDLLAGFISYETVSEALKEAGKAALYHEGRIADAVLCDAYGLTMFKIRVVAGVFVVLLGIDLGITGGAEKRQLLQNAIHEAVRLRIRLKRAAIVSSILRKKLQAILSACDALKRFGYTLEQLHQAQKKIAAEFKAEISKINDETARNALCDLDKNRHSWTNEDD